MTHEVSRNALTRHTITIRLDGTGFWRSARAVLPDRRCTELALSNVTQHSKQVLPQEKAATNKTVTETRQQEMTQKEMTQ
jgi:hypothetical protein